MHTSILQFTRLTGSTSDFLCESFITNMECFPLASPWPWVPGGHGCTSEKSRYSSLPLSQWLADLKSVTSAGGIAPFEQSWMFPWHKASDWLFSVAPFFTPTQSIEFMGAVLNSSLVKVCLPQDRFFIMLNIIKQLQSPLTLLARTCKKKPISHIVSRSYVTQFAWHHLLPVHLKALRCLHYSTSRGYLLITMQ